jgi:hypothetical protein
MSYEAHVFFSENDKFFITKMVGIVSKVFKRKKT